MVPAIVELVWNHLWGMGRASRPWRLHRAHGKLSAVRAPSSHLPVWAPCGRLGAAPGVVARSVSALSRPGRRSSFSGHLLTATLLLLLAGCTTVRTGDIEGDADGSAAVKSPFDPDPTVSLIDGGTDIEAADVSESPFSGEVIPGSIPEAGCQPDCTDRHCGSDGCGGLCGTCSIGQECSPNGQCGCEPDCTLEQCGDDGCGGLCGTCPDGQACAVNGQCACVPDCTDKQCGTDGCGGLCGTCPPGVQCAPNGECGCAPICGAKQCGDDGCGGSCGGCPAGQACTVSGQCMTCGGGCAGKECGDDGCGGVCGTCLPGETCAPDGTCGGGGCVSDCLGKECGPDGCGGLCGVCPAGQGCSPQGTCGGSCVADCGIKQCGDDGCGGLCGVCPVGQQCTQSGQCMCALDCTGKECGDDGCGGLCGTCPGGSTCSNTGQCGCAKDPFEKSGATCAAAYDVMSIVDNGALVAVAGNTLTAAESDWYTFLALDGPDGGGCDTFHVRVRFAVNPSDSYTFDVYKGSCDAKHCGGVTDFTWSTDFMEGDLGECPCVSSEAKSSSGTHVCTDNSERYYVAVHLAQGVESPCKAYKLEITNGFY